MSKYRKKAVVIEATQWFKNGDHPEDGNAVFEQGDFEGELLEGKVVRYYRHPNVSSDYKCLNCGDIMHNHGWVDAIQGGHVVCPSDWIITDSRVSLGKHGHFYPCKSDIFELTYDLVAEG